MSPRCRHRRIERDFPAAPVAPTVPAASAKHSPDSDRLTPPRTFDLIRRPPRHPPRFPRGRARPAALAACSLPRRTTPADLHLVPQGTHPGRPAGDVQPPREGAGLGLNLPPREAPVPCSPVDVPSRPPSPRSPSPGGRPPRTCTSFHGERPPDGRPEKSRVATWRCPPPANGDGRRRGVVLRGRSALTAPSDGTREHVPHGRPRHAPSRTAGDPCGPAPQPHQRLADSPRASHGMTDRHGAPVQGVDGDDGEGGGDVGGGGGGATGAKEARRGRRSDGRGADSWTQ